MNVKAIPVLLLFAFASLAHARPTDGCPAPGEGDPDLVRTIVRTSVPPLACASLKAKLAFSTGTDADFQFFRTVVPWYWDFLRRDAACAANKNRGVLRAEIHSISKDFRGLCAGDPHPENFALQFNPPPAPPTFGVNDPDDAGRDCPVVADLMRFLVGAKLALGDANAKAMIDRYVAAVTDSKAGAPRSAAVAALAAQGPKPEETALPNSGSPCGKGIREGLTKGYRETLAGTGLSLETEPTDANCVDVSASKEGGGSGGLPRYAIRFSVRSSDGSVTDKIVQFKGTQSNATAYYRDPPVAWDAKERYATACLAERGKDAVPCPVVAPVPGGPAFFARTKNERTVKFGKLSPEGAQAVYEDEAGALGSLHGRSLDAAKSAEYAKRILAVKDALDVDANALSTTVKKSAAALKSVLGVPGAFEAVCEPPKPSGAESVPPRPAPHSPPKRSQGRSAN